MGSCCAKCLQAGQDEMAMRITDIGDDELAALSRDTKILNIWLRDCEKLRAGDHFGSSDPCACVSPRRRFPQTSSLYVIERYPEARRPGPALSRPTLRPRPSRRTTTRRFIMPHPPSRHPAIFVDDMLGWDAGWGGGFLGKDVVLQLSGPPEAIPDGPQLQTSSCIAGSTEPAWRPFERFLFKVHDPLKTRLVVTVRYRRDTNCRFVVGSKKSKKKRLKTIQDDESSRPAMLAASTCRDERDEPCDLRPRYGDLT